jgi:hypothetical protein
MSSDSTTLDYAIVGAGVSGLYSGWRLLRDRAPGTPKPQIALFELSDRVGGRLLTVVPPGIPDARVELGGMRIIDPDHVWMCSLVELLGLETEPLPADERQNICYIRGTKLRRYELTDAAKLPYRIEGAVATKEALQNLPAYALREALSRTIEDVVGVKVRNWAELSTRVTPKDWEILAQQGKFDATPLYDLPLRYLMQQVLGHEALALAEDSGGYDSVLHTWNAADGFPWNVGDYGPRVSYLRVKEGYDKVPTLLAERFQEEGGRIHMNTGLQSFTSDRPQGPVTLTLTSAGNTFTVRAKRLILAMPRRSLELLEHIGPVLDHRNDDVWSLIASVTPIPLFKLAICYERAWWEEIEPVNPGTGLMAKITSGRSTTDLPIRQCFYWAVDRESGRAVILIYDDGSDLEYWAGLRLGEAPSSPDDPPVWRRHRAPHRMVAEVHKQLLEMHGITEPSVVPYPYSAAYRDWGEDPYGGGANFWPVGVRSYDVCKRIVQPKPPYPVYVCGSAYSHAQGWAEGAIQTAEDMLQRHLGLAPPDWKKERHWHPSHHRHRDHRHHES